MDAKVERKDLQSEGGVDHASWNIITSIAIVDHPRGSVLTERSSQIDAAVVKKWR